MKHMKTKFINGDPKRGVAYDWKAIIKAYKSLGCPPEYFDPTECPITECKYIMDFSRRGTGKSTGVMLLGMVMNAMYGTHIIYVRQTEDMILPKVTNDMFDVIMQNGYIQKITDGRWNGVKLYHRRWYYCNYDEDGKETERCQEHFCFMCDIVKANNLKSGFNDPMADYIIYDEFVNPAYVPDEFVKFCDLLSTIIRQRYSPIVWMLSNNTDKESPYFYEMECNDIVRSLSRGDGRKWTTERGTDCFVEWYAPEIKHSASKSILDKMNEIFFGFKNKKLGSITGEDWAIKPAQHIPRADVKFLIQNIYIKNHEKLVKLDFVLHPELGVCVYAHWATSIYDDSYIMTIEDRFDNRYRYGAGNDYITKLLLKAVKENRIYYASNDIAAFVRAYFSSIPKTM